MTFRHLKLLYERSTMSKKTLPIALALCCTLSSCSLLSNQPREQQQSVTSEQPSSTVDFELEAPATPSFGDAGTPEGEGVADTLYTIEDGVAYALDPNTLEKVGPPLDPITHEELEAIPEVTDTLEVSDTLVPEKPSFSQEPTVSSTPVPTVLPTPEQTVPPEEKLPNTGIFLEDD